VEGGGEEAWLPLLFEGGCCCGCAGPGFSFFPAQKPHVNWSSSSDSSQRPIRLGRSIFPGGKTKQWQNLHPLNVSVSRVFIRPSPVDASLLLLTLQKMPWLHGGTPQILQSFSVPVDMFLVFKEADEPVADSDEEDSDLDP